MPSSPKIKPCPFCGGECVVIDWELTYTVDCVAGECVYAAGHTSGESEAIAAHNKVAGAVEGAQRYAEANQALAQVVNDAVEENAKLREKLAAAEREVVRVGEWWQQRLNELEPRREEARKTIAERDAAVARAEKAESALESAGANVAHLMKTALARAAAGDALLREVMYAGVDDDGSPIVCIESDEEEWFTRRDAHIAPPAAGEVKP